MTVRNASGTAFWSIRQNNSGGNHDIDDDFGIGEVMCVEALSDVHAEERLRVIIASYPDSGSCECCGERWSVDCRGDDGTPVATRYGDAFHARDIVYVHYLDGTFERIR